MYDQNSLIRKFLKLCSLVLSVIFTFTSVVQADTAAAIGQRSRNVLPAVIPSPSVAPNALDVLADFPAEYGTLKSKFQGQGNQIVIHIQDAHVNEDAQKNIAHLLSYFSEKHHLGLVNIEGAEGELATEYFKFVPSKQARQSVADYFLRQGRLSGTEYSVIVDQPDFVVNGVEDKALYDENRKAYLDALKFKEADEEVLAKLYKTLNDVSRFVFSSEVRDLNAKRLVFQQSGHDLVAYVRALQTMAVKNKINLAEYAGMQSLIDLTELESQINFDKAEKETDALIRDVKKSLPSEQLSEFLTKTVHYRMKKMRRGEFYGYLSSLANQVLEAEARKDYANALSYLRYIRSYDNIDATLFDEIAALDQAVRVAEFKEEGQKGLDHLWRIYDVISKLFDFTLTKDDAEFYFAHRAEFNAQTFQKFLEPKLVQYHFSYGLPSLENLDRDLPRLEKFYDFAIKRDSILIENAISKANSASTRLSAIVTGGFHTPGIERKLKEQGISYLVVTPKITKAIDQAKDAKLYEDAMKGVPLKIEKQIDQALAAQKKSQLNDPRFQLAVEPMFSSHPEILAEALVVARAMTAENRSAALESISGIALPGQITRVGMLNGKGLVFEVNGSYLLAASEDFKGEVRASTPDLVISTGDTKFRVVFSNLADPEGVVWASRAAQIGTNKPSTQPVAAARSEIRITANFPVVKEFSDAVLASLPKWIDKDKVESMHFSRELNDMEANKREGYTVTVANSQGKQTYYAVASFVDSDFSDPQYMTKGVKFDGWFADKKSYDKYIRKTPVVKAPAKPGKRTDEIEGTAAKPKAKPGNRLGGLEEQPAASSAKAGRPVDELESAPARDNQITLADTSLVARAQTLAQNLEVRQDRWIKIRKWSVRIIAIGLVAAALFVPGLNTFVLSHVLGLAVKIGGAVAGKYIAGVATAFLASVIYFFFASLLSRGLSLVGAAFLRLPWKSAGENERTELYKLLLKRDQQKPAVSAKLNEILNDIEIPAPTVFSTREHILAYIFAAAGSGETDFMERILIGSNGSLDRVSIDVLKKEAARIDRARKAKARANAMQQDSEHQKKRGFFALVQKAFNDQKQELGFGGALVGSLAVGAQSYLKSNQYLNANGHFNFNVKNILRLILVTPVMTFWHLMDSFVFSHFRYAASWDNMSVAERKKVRLEPIEVYSKIQGVQRDYEGGRGALNTALDRIGISSVLLLVQDLFWTNNFAVQGFAGFIARRGYMAIAKWIGGIVFGLAGLSLLGLPGLVMGLVGSMATMAMMKLPKKFEDSQNRAIYTQIQQSLAQENVSADIREPVLALLRVLMLGHGSNILSSKEFKDARDLVLGTQQQQVQQVIRDILPTLMALGRFSVTDRDYIFTMVELLGIKKTGPPSSLYRIPFVGGLYRFIRLATFDKDARSIALRSLADHLLPIKINLSDPRAKKLSFNTQFVITWLEILWAGINSSWVLQFEIDCAFHVADSLDGLTHALHMSNAATAEETAINDQVAGATDVSAALKAAYHEAAKDGHISDDEGYILNHLAKAAQSEKVLDLTAAGRPDEALGELYTVTHNNAEVLHVFRDAINQIEGRALSFVNDAVGGGRTAQDQHIQHEIYSAIRAVDQAAERAKTVTTEPAKIVTPETSKTTAEGEDSLEKRARDLEIAANATLLKSAQGEVEDISRASSDPRVKQVASQILKDIDVLQNSETGATLTDAAVKSVAGKVEQLKKFVADAESEAKAAAENQAKLDAEKAKQEALDVAKKAEEMKAAKEKADHDARIAAEQAKAKADAEAAQRREAELQVYRQDLQAFVRESKTGLSSVDVAQLENLAAAFRPENEEQLLQARNEIEVFVKSHMPATPTPAENIRAVAAAGVVAVASQAIEQAVAGEKPAVEKPAKSSAEATKAKDQEAPVLSRDAADKKIRQAIRAFIKSDPKHRHGDVSDVVFALDQIDFTDPLSSGNYKVNADGQLVLTYHAYPPRRLLGVEFNWLNVFGDPAQVVEMPIPDELIPYLEAYLGDKVFGIKDPVSGEPQSKLKLLRDKGTVNPQGIVPAPSVYLGTLRGSDIKEAMTTGDMTGVNQTTQEILKNAQAVQTAKEPEVKPAQPAEAQQSSQKPQTVSPEETAAKPVTRTVEEEYREAVVTVRQAEENLEKFLGGQLGQSRRDTVITIRELVRDGVTHDDSNLDIALAVRRLARDGVQGNWLVRTLRSGNVKQGAAWFIQSQERMQGLEDQIKQLRAAQKNLDHLKEARDQVHQTEKEIAHQLKLKQTAERDLRRASHDILLKVSTAKPGDVLVIGRTVTYSEKGASRWRTATLQVTPQHIEYATNKLAPTPAENVLQGISQDVSAIALSGAVAASANATQAAQSLFVESTSPVSAVPAEASGAIRANFQPPHVTQVDVATILNDRPAAAQTVESTARAAAVGATARAFTEMTESLNLNPGEQRENAQLGLERAIQDYNQRVLYYLINELKSRVHYAGNIGAVSDEIRQSLDARSGLPETLTEELLHRLEIQVQNGDLTKLNRTDYEAAINNLMNDPKFLNSLSTQPLSAPERDVLVRMLVQSLDGMFNPNPMPRSAEPSDTDILQIDLGLPLYREGQPLSEAQLIDLAIAERLKTQLASGIIERMKANLTRSARGSHLSLIVRAGTDFNAGTSGIGIEVSTYVSDPSKATRLELADVLDENSRLVLQREIADVVHEVRIHLANYARASALERGFADLVEGLKPAEVEAARRTADNMDTDAAFVTGKLHRALQADFEDRHNERVEIKRLLGGLIGVVDQEIVLDQSLETMAAHQNVDEQAAIRADIAEKMRQHGIQVERNATLDLAIARGQYAAQSLEIAYQKAREKMAVVFNLRAFVNPVGGGIELRSPLTFQRDPKTPDSVYWAQRERLALQYYLDAQKIAAGREDLEASIRRAQEIATLAEASYAEAERVLTESYQQYSNEAGWSRSFVAAVQKYELERIKLEHAYEFQQKLQSEVDRFSAGVQTTVDNFDRNYESDQTNEPEDSHKILNAAVFEEMERAYQSPAAQVDGTTLESSLASGRNLNLRLESLRATETAERLIQALDNAGLHLSARFDRFDLNHDGKISANETNVTVDNLQKLERNLFEEYERASSPASRGWMERLQDQFRAKPRAAQVILEDIRRVNAAKHAALDLAMPGVMRGVWTRQAGYDSTGRDGKSTHVTGTLENKIKEAQDVLASAQASREEKEKAQRDLQALQFALNQVRADLDALGQQGQDIQFRSQSLLRGGVEGIVLIPGTVGVGISTVWNLNQHYDGQIDFLYQSMRQSQNLESAHARDYVSEVLQQRQFLDQIPLRIAEYQRGVQAENQIIANLRAQQELATPRQKEELERKIHWAQSRLFDFSEALVNLPAELDRAKARYVRLLGHDTTDQLTFSPRSAAQFYSEENFRDQIRRGMEEWVPEAERRTFDPAVDDRIADQRVRLQWSLLAAAEEQNYTQLSLMLPFISGEGMGGSASLRTYSGHLSKDQKLDVTIAGEDLRRTYEMNREFEVHANLAADTQTRQIENTRSQKAETERLISDIQTNRRNNAQKANRGYAGAGELNLYNAIGAADLTEQENNHYIHELNLRLLQIQGAGRDAPAHAPAWSNDEQALMNQVNGGAAQLFIGQGELDNLLHATDDREAKSNSDISQEIAAIQNQYRYLRHAAVSTEAFRVPMGLGSADDLQAGIRLTYDPLEALTDTQAFKAKLRDEQARDDLQFRQDFKRRLVQLAWEDVRHAQSILEIRRQQADWRLQIARSLANVAGALEDRHAIMDSVNRTSAMVATAENDLEIAKNMFKFITGIPQSVELQVSGVNLLEQVVNGESVGQEVVTQLLENAFHDPRYEVILKNIKLAEADERQAWNKRWFQSQAGAFAGYHPGVGAELTVHLIDREKAALVEVEKAKARLTELQSEPFLHQIQMQALNEYAAFIQNRIRLIQLATEYEVSQNRAEDAVGGYRVAGGAGRTVKTMNDVLIALDENETTALKLAELQFAFRKASSNLARTMNLFGLPEEAQRVSTAGHKALPYQSVQTEALVQMQASQARVRDAEEKLKTAKVPAPVVAPAETEDQAPSQIYDKLKDPKTQEHNPPREDYLDAQNQARYAERVRNLWKDIFGADTARVERAEDGKARGGLSEPILVEDVFVRLFDVMQLNDQERSVMLEILRVLAQDQYVGGKLKREDVQQILLQIPETEKLGLNYAQVIEGLLSAETLAAKSQDATNSELDKQTDFRILGLYVYYAANILKGIDPGQIERTPSDQVGQLVAQLMSGNFDAGFRQRLDRDFIFLPKVWANIAAQTEANQANRASAYSVVFAPAEIDFLTQNGTMSASVEIKDKRVDFATWAAQERQLGSTATDDQLKAVFVQRALVDWFAYSDREVSEAPYYKFLLRNDTFEDFEKTRETINELYRTVFGKDLALYGDIKDLSNITAWQFLTFMGKLYSPDEAVRSSRLQNIVLLASHVLQFEQVSLNQLYGSLSDQDLRAMPSAVMLRLLEQNQDPSYQNEREIRKERESLRNGLFFGEVIFRTIFAVEQYANRHQLTVEQALDQMGASYPSIGDGSPALRVTDQQAIAEIRRDIHDFYTEAPKIRDIYNHSNLSLKFPLDYRDPNARGSISAIYDFKVKNQLSDEELRVYFDYMAQLKDDVLTYHRITQNIDFADAEQQRLGRYPAVLSTEVLEMIHRGWTVERMKQFIHRKINIYESAREYWVDRPEGSRLPPETLGLYVEAFEDLQKAYPQSGVDLDSRESTDQIFKSVNFAQGAVQNAGDDLIQELSNMPSFSWETDVTRLKTLENIRQLSNRSAVVMYLGVLKQRDVPEGEAVYLGTERLFKRGESLNDLDRLKKHLMDELRQELYWQAVYMTFNQDSYGNPEDLSNSVVGYLRDNLARAPENVSRPSLWDTGMIIKYTAVAEQYNERFKQRVAQLIGRPDLAEKVPGLSDRGGIGGLVQRIYERGLKKNSKPGNSKDYLSDQAWQSELNKLFDDTSRSLAMMYQHNGYFPDWSYNPALVNLFRDDDENPLNQFETMRAQGTAATSAKLDPLLMDLGSEFNTMRALYVKWIQVFGEIPADELLQRELNFVAVFTDNAASRDDFIERQAAVRDSLNRFWAPLLSGTRTAVEVVAEIDAGWNALFERVSTRLVNAVQSHSDRTFEQTLRDTVYNRASKSLSRLDEAILEQRAERKQKYNQFVAAVQEYQSGAMALNDAVLRLQQMARDVYGLAISAEEARILALREKTSFVGPRDTADLLVHRAWVVQLAKRDFGLDLNGEEADLVIAKFYSEGLSPKEAVFSIFYIPRKVAEIYNSELGVNENSKTRGWAYVGGLAAEISKTMGFIDQDPAVVSKMLGEYEKAIHEYVLLRLNNPKTTDAQKEELRRLDQSIQGLTLEKFLALELDRTRSRLKLTAILQRQYRAIGLEKTQDRLLLDGGNAYMNAITPELIENWAQSVAEVRKLTEEKLGKPLDAAHMKEIYYLADLWLELGLAKDVSRDETLTESEKRKVDAILDYFSAELMKMNQNLDEAHASLRSATEISPLERERIIQAIERRKVDPDVFQTQVVRLIELRRQVLDEAQRDIDETRWRAILLENDMLVNRTRAPRGSYDLTRALSPIEMLVGHDALLTASDDRLMLDRFFNKSDEDMSKIQRPVQSMRKYLLERKLRQVVPERVLHQNWSRPEKIILALSRGEGVVVLGNLWFEGVHFKLFWMVGVVGLIAAILKAIAMVIPQWLKKLQPHIDKKASGLDLQNLPRFLYDRANHDLSFRYVGFKAAVFGILSAAMTVLLLQMSFITVAPAMFAFFATFFVTWAIIPDVFILKSLISIIGWFTSITKPVMIEYKLRTGKTVKIQLPRGLMKVIPAGFKTAVVSVVRNNGGSGDIENMETLFRDTAKLLVESRDDPNLVSVAILQFEAPLPEVAKISEVIASLKKMAPQDPNLDEAQLRSTYPDDVKLRAYLWAYRLRLIRADSERRYREIIAEAVDDAIDNGLISPQARTSAVEAVQRHFTIIYTYTNVPKPDPYFKLIRFLNEGGELFDPLSEGTDKVADAQAYLKADAPFNPDGRQDQSGDTGFRRNARLQNGFAGLIGGPADESDPAHLLNIQQQTLQNRQATPILELIRQRRTLFRQHSQALASDSRPQAREDQRYFDDMAVISEDYEASLGDFLRSLESSGVLGSWTAETLTVEGVDKAMVAFVDAINDRIKNLRKAIQDDFVKQGGDLNHLTVQQRQSQEQSLQAAVDIDEQIHTSWKNLERLAELQERLLKGYQTRVLTVNALFGIQIFDAGNNTRYFSFRRLVQYAMRTPAMMIQGRIKFAESHMTLHSKLAEDVPNNTLSHTHGALQAYLRMIRAFGKFYIHPDIFYPTQARPWLISFASLIRYQHGIILPISEDEIQSSNSELMTGIGPQFADDYEIGEDPTFNLRQRLLRSLNRWMTFHDMGSYFKSQFLPSVYHHPILSAFRHTALLGGVLTFVGYALMGVSSFVNIGWIAIAAVVFFVVLAVFYFSIHRILDGAIKARDLGMPDHAQGGKEINSVNNTSLVMELFFLLQLVVMASAMLSGGQIVIIAPMIGQLLFQLTVFSLWIVAPIFGTRFAISNWLYLQRLGQSPPLWKLFYDVLFSFAASFVEKISSTAQLLAMVVIMPFAVIRAFLRVFVAYLYEMKHPITKGAVGKAIEGVWQVFEWGEPWKASWVIAGTSATNADFKQFFWVWKGPMSLGIIFLALWLSPVVPLLALQSVGVLAGAWYLTHAIYGGGLLRYISFEKIKWGLPRGLGLSYDSSKSAESQYNASWNLKRGDAIVGFLIGLGLIIAMSGLPTLALLTPAAFLSRITTIVLGSFLLGLFWAFVFGFNIVKVDTKIPMKNAEGKIVWIEYQKGLFKKTGTAIDEAWVHVFTWILFGVTVAGAWIFSLGVMPDFIKDTMTPFLQLVNRGDGSSLAGFLMDPGYNQSLRESNLWNWFFNIFGGGMALGGVLMIALTIIIIAFNYFQERAALRWMDKTRNVRLAINAVSDLDELSQRLHAAAGDGLGLDLVRAVDEIRVRSVAQGGDLDMMRKAKALLPNWVERLPKAEREKTTALVRQALYRSEDRQPVYVIEWNPNFVTSNAAAVWSILSSRGTNSTAYQVLALEFGYIHVVKTGEVRKNNMRHVTNFYVPDDLSGFAEVLNKPKSEVTPLDIADLMDVQFNRRHFFEDDQTQMWISYRINHGVTLDILPPFYFFDEKIENGWDIGSVMNELYLRVATPEVLRRDGEGDPHFDLEWDKGQVSLLRIIKQFLLFFSKFENAWNFVLNVAHGKMDLSQDLALTMEMQKALVSPPVKSILQTILFGDDNKTPAYEQMQKNYKTHFDMVWERNHENAPVRDGVHIGKWLADSLNYRLNRLKDNKTPDGYRALKKEIISMHRIFMELYYQVHVTILGHFPTRPEFYPQSHRVTDNPSAPATPAGSEASKRSELRREEAKSGVERTQNTANHFSSAGAEMDAALSSVAGQRLDAQITPLGAALSVKLDHAVDLILSELSAAETQISVVEYRGGDVVEFVKATAAQVPNDKTVTSVNTHLFITNMSKADQAIAAGAVRGLGYRFDLQFRSDAFENVVMPLMRQAKATNSFHAFAPANVSASDYARFVNSNIRLMRAGFVAVGGNQRLSGFTREFSLADELSDKMQAVTATGISA